MWAGAATMEKRIEAPLQTKKRTTIWLNNPIPRHIPRENHNLKTTHELQCLLQHYLQQPGDGSNLKCSSREKQIKTMWYVYTMEYYSAIKRNGTVPFAETWMDLETVTQSEVSQRQKKKLYINAYMWNLEKWYRWSYQYLQSINRETDEVNKHMVTKEVRGGEINWEIGTDIYTLLILCIK